MVREIIGKRLKEIRHERNLTLKEVSEGTGVSISMLSKIERGETTPTIDLIIKIATFFHISLGDLVGFDTRKETVKMNGADHPLIVTESNCSMQLLTKYSPDVNIDFFRIVVPPGKTFSKKMIHPPNTHHVVYCENGEGYLYTNGEKIHFARGDTLEFPGDMHHDYENTGEEDLILFSILLYRR